jgi:endonuclease YncB( thermonuclease family)
MAALALAAGAGRAGAAQPAALRAATISRVEDGRTVWLDARGAAPMRARLAWIAAPAAPAAKAGGEPHGAEARQHLEVWKGQPVEFRSVATDRDGTALVEVLWRPTAESVVTLNYEMVRSGFARADCALAGEFDLQCRVLRKAEEVARQERRGMWAGHP